MRPPSKHLQEPFGRLQSTMNVEGGASPGLFLSCFLNLLQNKYFSVNSQLCYTSWESSLFIPALTQKYLFSLLNGLVNIVLTDPFVLMQFQGCPFTFMKDNEVISGRASYLPRLFQLFIFVHHMACKVWEVPLENWGAEGTYPIKCTSLEICHILLMFAGALKFENQILQFLSLKICPSHAR